MKAINFLLPLAIFSFLGLIFIFTKGGSSASPKTTATSQDTTPQEPTLEPKVTIQITKSETSTNSSASATVQVVTTDSNGSQTVNTTSTANTGGNVQDDDQSNIETGDASAKSTVKTNSN